MSSRPRQRIAKTLTIFFLTLSACQPKKVEMSEEVWQDFVRSLDFPREYAMRRSPVDTLYLRRALKDESQLVRYNAAQDLLRMGEDASDAVVELVECTESTPKKAADLCDKSLQQFSPLPDAAIVPLLPKLGIRFSPSTARAKLLLANIARGDVAYDSEIAMQISSSLQSNNATQQAEAARLAGLKGLEPERATLIRLLEEGSDEVQLGAAIGLSYFPTDAAEVQEAKIEKELKKGLGRTSGARQKEIARILDVELPKRAISIAKLKKERAEEGSEGAKSESSTTIKTVDASQQHDSMLAVRVAQDVVREISLRRLEKREPERLDEWKRQLPYLRTAVSSGSRSEQVAAVRVLGAMADYLQEALALLLRALASTEPEVRERAAKLLGEHRVEQAVGPLSGLLAENSTREAAATALLRIGTKEAREEAKRYLSEEEMSKISAEKVVLRGEDNISAGGVRQLCERELRRRGYSNPSLQTLSKDCVRASGAYY